MKKECGAQSQNRAVTFTFHMPRFRLDALRKVARDDGRSVSGLLNKLAQDEINRKG